MKVRFITTLSIALLLLLGVVSVYALDTTNWYQYNGYSTSHSFSVKYPTDWKARTSGDDLQGFGPANIYDETYFQIHEFEGYTYNNAINSFVNENTSLIETTDTVLEHGNDIIAKTAIYTNKEDNTSFSMTFIKRGALILALSNSNLEENSYPIPSQYNSIVEEIVNSFDFTDDWHQYVDYQEKFTFIFPSSLTLTNLDNSVVLSDPLRSNKEIFSVNIYEDTSISQAMEEAAAPNEEYQKSTDITFHGIKNAKRATYLNEDDDKTFTKIFISSDSSTICLTDTNFHPNYPHLDYYDTYISEILESFEFFNIDGTYTTYKYFPDVRDNHTNAISINYLTENEIIDGYPDGTFKPDNQINRAELTKLVVASVLEPDPETYNNCFPDVEDQWFAPYICYAEEQEWVEGYPNGLFRPEQSVNRVEAIKIVLEVLFKNISNTETAKNPSPYDIDTEDWYGKYFIFADNRELLDKQHITQEGENYYYHPQQESTRKEVAELIFRSIRYNEIF